MAQGGNFVEGRLRLSAYLRIVRDIPQHRPFRIRRRVAERGNDESHNNPEPASIVVSEIRAEAESSNLATDSNEACHSHVVPPSAPALAVPPSDPSFFGPPIAPEEVENFTYPESDSPVIDGASTIERFPSTFSNTPRRIVNVYKAKRDKLDARLVTSTRRRRLPINELALVRRTTDISLSDRSEEVPEPRPITETDPIEDNQNSPFYTNGASGSSQILRTFANAKSPSTSAPKSRWKIGKTKKLTSTPGAKLIPRSLTVSLSSLCADGFLASELKLPTRIKQEKRTPSPDKAKHARRTVPIPAPIGSLELRSGPLPRPRSISPPDPLFSGGDPVPAEASSSLTLITLRGDILSDEDDNIPQSSTRTEEYIPRPRRLTDDIVIAQLSAVTAPARRNTDSDQDEEDASMDDEATSIATEILEAEPSEASLSDGDEEAFDFTPYEDQHDDSGFCEDYTLLQEQRSATVETDFWSQYGPDMD